MLQLSALCQQGPNYLSQDQADIGFLTKERCREFAIPNRNSQGNLKRVCRHLAGKPRLVHQYNWGDGVEVDQRLEVFVDTDLAGCKETRRSTSGGVCLLNRSINGQWLKTQHPLSSHQEKPSCIGSMQGSPKRSACNRPLRTLDFNTRLESIAM